MPGNRLQSPLRTDGPCTLRRLLVLVLGLAAGPLASAETPLVAIDSNLAPALEELAAHYRMITGRDVNLSFGNSRSLGRQIQRGAPYTLFLSADAESVRNLSRDNPLGSEPVPLAIGRIGFFIPTASPLSRLTSINALIKALYFNDNTHRIAIADPQRDPHGKAAVQTLQNGGLWILSEQGMLIADNAAQVGHYVLSGGTGLGIIPASLARLPRIAESGRFIPIPESWHDPIRQYLTLLGGAEPESVAFFHFLQGEQARQTLGKYGYDLPERHR